MIDTLRRRYVAFLRSLPNRSLSTSDDFVTWTPPRVSIEARPGEEVNIVYNHMGFVYGDRVYIYYGGLANRHKPYEGKDEAYRRGGGLGLATLRLDGFASLQAS